LLKRAVFPYVPGTGNIGEKKEGRKGGAGVKKRIKK
jgi:hypothetical protein